MRESIEDASKEENKMNFGYAQTLLAPRMTPV